MAAFRQIILVVFIFSAAGVCAQVNRYVVHFKDKTGTPFVTGSPEAFLSQRSIARRVKQSIPVIAEDLPVNPAYVAQTATAGARTFYTSRWMNCVLAEIHQDTVALITALPFVDSVEFVAPGSKLSGGRTRKSMSKFSVASAKADASLPQFQQLEIDVMHSAGFHGENISIAVLDAGFASVDTAVPFQELIQRGGIKQGFNFVTRSRSIYLNCGDCNHGTEVLSVMAVNTADFNGGAYAADYYLYVTEDTQSEYRIEEYNWLFAAEKSDSAGVDVISSSLGYNTFDDPEMDYTIAKLNGTTTVIAKAAVAASTRGMIVVVSAGNEGDNSWHYITTPADANGVIATGAVTASGDLAPFSSFGPNASGQIKPDVVACGVAVSVVLPSGAIGANSGTSFSCPLVASLSAGVWQAYPSLTSSEVYTAIIHSGNRSASPDNSFGYGIPKFTAIGRFIEASRGFSLYPNPYITGGIFDPAEVNKIKISFAYNSGLTDITCYDALGKLVSQQTGIVATDADPVSFDIAALTPGVYFIRITNNLVTKTVRFIKS